MVIGRCRGRPGERERGEVGEDGPKQEIQQGLGCNIMSQISFIFVKFTHSFTFIINQNWSECHIYIVLRRQRADIRLQEVGSDMSA